MAYDTKTKHKAFKLFCLGKSLTEISHEKGMPSEPTLKQWRSNNKWDIKRSEIDEKTNQKLSENISDFKINMLNEIKSFKDKLLLEFDNCSNPTKDKLTDSLVKLQQQELLLRGEATDRKEIKGELNTTHEEKYEIINELIEEPAISERIAERFRSRVGNSLGKKQIQ